MMSNLCMSTGDLTSLRCGRPEAALIRLIPNYVIVTTCGTYSSYKMRMFSGSRGFEVIWDWQHLVTGVGVEFYVWFTGGGRLDRSDD